MRIFVAPYVSPNVGRRFSRKRVFRVAAGNGRYGSVRFPHRIRRVSYPDTMRIRYGSGKPRVDFFVSRVGRDGLFVGSTSYGRRMDNRENVSKTGCFRRSADALCRLGAGSVRDRCGTVSPPRRKSSIGCGGSVRRDMSRLYRAKETAEKRLVFRNGKDVRREFRSDDLAVESSFASCKRGFRALPVETFVGRLCPFRYPRRFTVCPCGYGAKVFLRVFVSIGNIRSEEASHPVRQPEKSEYV